MRSSRTHRSPRPKVVVLGAGFAGVAAVKELGRAPVDVTLVDRNGYNTFQPLLYQVATGGLNPGDVTYAARALTARQANVAFRKADVVGVDVESRVVTLADGKSVGYDYLIVATGVTTNYFGVPGAEEHAMAMYTRRQALEVRDSLFGNLEGLAQATEDGERSDDPTVVVVGAGATGVEMAGSLAELGNTAMHEAYPELAQRRARVVLVEMGPHVLAPFHPKLRDYTARMLRKRGVDLRLETTVQAVHADGVELDDGERIRAGNVIWAAGVRAPDIVQEWGLPQGRGGRVEVGSDLSLAGHPEVFVAGDLGVDPDDPLPQLAQPAIQGGKHAARQIRRRVDGADSEPFAYFDKGLMATIGRGAAIAQLRGGVRLRGVLAWLAWLVLHIVSLLGGRNRVVTMLNLTARYVTWPRNLNVIVGD